jgi:hypothetical protein
MVNFRDATPEDVQRLAELALGRLRDEDAFREELARQCPNLAQSVQDLARGAGRGLDVRDVLWALVIVLNDLASPGESVVVRMPLPLPPGERRRGQKWTEGS